MLNVKSGFLFQQKFPKVGLAKEVDFQNNLQIRLSVTFAGKESHS
jgi:hypothetical protein